MTFGATLEGSFPGFSGLFKPSQALTKPTRAGFCSVLDSGFGFSFFPSDSHEPCLPNFHRQSGAFETTQIPAITLSSCSPTAAAAVHSLPPEIKLPFRCCEEASKQGFICGFLIAKSPHYPQRLFKPLGQLLNSACRKWVPCLYSLSLFRPILSFFLHASISYTRDACLNEKRHLRGDPALALALHESSLLPFSVCGPLRQRKMY